MLYHLLVAKTLLLISSLFRSSLKSEGEAGVVIKCCTFERAVDESC